jgi:trimethylamine:corrinoid methyltransferase-like protein
MAMRPFEFLSDSDVRSIVEDAYRVLESVGVQVENAEGKELLLRRAAVPPALRGGRITIPPALIRMALDSVPSQFLLYDRDGTAALEIGGPHVHFDPGSAAVHILDPKSQRRRSATHRDVIDLVHLVDQLPNYALQSTALVAGDVPAEIADRYRLYLALRYGRKPIITGTFRKDGFAPMHAMLAAVRGGADALERKPLAIFDCCVSPPLKWSDLTCQALIDCARTGVPAEVIPMPMTGATSPVTLRHTLVQHCAENLSGLVIHQIARPGAPFVFGGAPTSFDMRYGTTSMGAMETMMLAAGYAQIGRHLRLPTHGYLCVSDAKTNDYQAGLESGTGALLGALAGINMISGAGMLDFLLTQSLEKLVLDHEACGMVLRALRGIEADSSDAVALINELVTLPEFLSHEHTLEHWRNELSLPSPVIDRAIYADWEADGAKTAEERARSEVKRLLRNEPAALDPKIVAALDEIMAATGRGSFSSSPSSPLSS